MAGLATLTKKRANRVMGIDASTYSLAFCVFYNRRPERWGKIEFEGADVFERIRDAGKKLHAVADTFDNVGYIAMEGAILANNRNVDVTIKLSLMYGAILSELLRHDAEVVHIKPSEWQNYLGNKNFTKAEKEALKLEIPGKSASWYSNEIRTRRKQRTMDFFNEKWPDLKLTDNDVGDSFGLSYFGYHKKTSRT